MCNIEGSIIGCENLMPVTTYIQLFQPLSLQCTCTPRSKVVYHAHCSTPHVAALALQSLKVQYAQTTVLKYAVKAVV